MCLRICICKCLVHNYVYLFDTACTIYINKLIHYHDYFIVMCYSHKYRIMFAFLITNKRINCHKFGIFVYMFECYGVIFLHTCVSLLVCEPSFVFWAVDRALQIKHF